MEKSCISAFLMVSFAFAELMGTLQTKGWCMKPHLKELEAIIDQAQGNVKASLVIKNVSIFCLSSGELRRGDIAVCGDRIVGAGESYDGETEIDGNGLFAVPGFIDAHVHIESSMIPPFEFERCVLPRGVTTAFCDPHELANVAGTRAIDFFMESARRMCMDLRVQISSCVPATPLETSGASLSADDIRRYASEMQSAGLAELMNVPGVLSKVPDVLEKIALFHGRIDGHCPMLAGKALNAYLASGVRNCHECSSLAEAEEKLAKGMQILIREGSIARNLDTLLPLITVANAPFLCFCTDDRNPLDIGAQGHLDYMIRHAIAKGADPLAVYRVACWSPARHFGLFDRGLIAPGYRADIVLLSDLENCAVAKVLKNGGVVDDTLFAARGEAPDPSEFLHSVRMTKVSPDAFRVCSSAAETPVIGIRELSLITDHLTMELPFDGREKQCAPERDVAKVAVLERYGKNGNIGLGFVKGFGLRSGAIASSVGHDSHNICVVGVSDSDMALAVNALIESGGGFSAANRGEVLDVLPLPLGGLLSCRDFVSVERDLRRIHASVKATGCPLETPFLQLAFLPLPVIPHLRITDKGMVDVAKFDFIGV